ncbi:MAG: hypothetical protein AAGJ11_03855 [Bacteroidota bacterium]
MTRTRTRPLPSLRASASGEAPPLDRAHFAEGADATVHQVPGRPDLVAKLYRKAGPERRAKLEAMLDAPPDRHVTTWQGAPVVELAWPVEMLSDGAEAVGFLMPAVDLAEAVLLEHVLTPRARRAAQVDASVRFRVAVAANLAASVAALHARGHHVVDLKPANLHVYRRSGLVAILDCDGMSIAGLDGARFPAHQYTDGYIAPEAVRERRPPEALGEPQDRFALAVVVFQLLCDGLHPFQGVPSDPAVVPTTNGERIGAGLYPYGSGGASLAPPPKSLYPFLDEATQALFTRAFDRAPESRPSAAEWRDHLRALLDGGLGPCDRDPDHARFGGKLCGACETDPLVQRRRRREALAARRPVVSDETIARWKRGLTIAGGLLFMFFFAITLFRSDPISDPRPMDGDLAVVFAIHDGDPEAVAEAVRRTPDVLAPDAHTDVTSYAPLVREAGFPQPVDPVLSVEDHWIARSVARGTPGTTAMLLALGANPNTPDPRGRLALHHAAGLPPLINVGVAPDFLLDAGEQLATAALRSPSRERRYFHPEDNGWWTITPTGPELVSIGGLNLQNDLVEHAAHLRLIAQATDDLDAVDLHGRTALAYAAASGNGAAILTLLRLGADPNVADAAGVTPLMHLADRVASGTSDALAARLMADLIVGGANPDQRDNAGRSAYRYLGPATGWEPGLGADRESARLRTASLLLDAASVPEAERAERLDQEWAWDFFGTPRSSSLAESSADVDDAASRFAFDQDLPTTYAATLPRPPWVQNAEVEVVCRSVPPTVVEATAHLRLTSPRVAGVQQGGVGDRVALEATDWIDRASLGDEALWEDSEALAQRTAEVRARERCLARAGNELPRRFDVRGNVAMSGPVTIRVTAP